MSALIVTVLLTSVLGSFHCAGMCGAFLAIATGGLERAGAYGHAVLQAAYHSGRLLTYTLLGAAAGTAGRLVDLAGTLAGIRPIAAALAGATMLTFGIVTLLQTAGFKVGWRIRWPWSPLIQRGHRAAMNCPPLLRPFLIGLLTTLLPCGWLYAFAITAAGTGSTARGALTMAVFWVGTMPMMVALGAGLRGAIGPIGRKLPVITAVALTITGAYTLMSRAALDPRLLVAKQTTMATTSTASAPSNVKPDCCQIHDH